VFCADHAVLYELSCVSCLLRLPEFGCSVTVAVVATAAAAAAALFAFS
jgi:hypothetical protein